MPTFQDPRVSEATVKLKSAQTRLTHLRRRHLQGDYIAKATFESFVLALANDFRRELLTLPGLIRRAVSETVIKDKWMLEDAVERALDQWLCDFSSRPIPDLPKPERSRGGYSTKPGPKPRRKATAAPVMEAAE